MITINNITALKRSIEVGTTLCLDYHIRSQFPTDFNVPNKRIGIERKVTQVQTNAIKFEDGSWLYFPKAMDYSDCSTVAVPMFEVHDKRISNGVEVTETLGYSFILK